MKHVVIGIVSLLLFTGCVSRVAQPKWYMTSLGAEPVTLNPVTASDMPSARVCGYIFNGLITINKKLEVIPELASSWEISPDHLVYTFHLRKDVTWHDGVKFTAADVKFTFDKIMDPLSKAMNKRGSYIDVAKAEAVDDYTFRVTYKRPYSPALTSWGTSIIPKHLFEGVNFLDNKYNRAPVGTGPYRFVEWKTGQNVIIEKITNHFRDNPAIERIVFKIIKDSAMELNAYKRGDVDGLGMTPDQWEKEKNNPAMTSKSRMLIYSVLSFSYLGWNMDGSNPFFADKTVRQAMCHAMPVEDLVKRIYRGHARAISGPFHPDVWAYDTNVAPYKFDLALAAKKLEAAGWVDADKDGVREKMINGKKTKFIFEVLYTEGSSVGENVLVLFKENLEKIGVTMEIHKIEWTAFIKKIHSHEFTACLLGWSLDIDPDPTALFHSREIGKGLNYYGYRNAEVDSLCDEGLREFDRQKRAAIYHRVHRILNDECPYTFLVASQALVALHKRFENVEVAPTGIYDFHPGLLGWKIRQ